MGVLSLNKLEVVFDDLVSRGAPELRETIAGRLHLEDVEALRGRIAALRTAQNAPPLPIPGKAEITAVMQRQNGFATMIQSSIAGLDADPNQKKNMRAAIEEARTRVFDTRLSASASAMARVEAAQALAPKVEAHSKCLAALPYVGGGTVLDRTREYLACADELAQLVGQRAAGRSTAVGSVKARDVLAVIQDGMNVVKDLRATLTAEVRKNPALPRDLVARVFAVYEEALAASRPARRSVVAAEGVAA